MLGGIPYEPRDREADERKGIQPNHHKEENSI